MTSAGRAAAAEAEALSSELIDALGRDIEQAQVKVVAARGRLHATNPRNLIRLVRTLYRTMQAEAELKRLNRLRRIAMDTFSLTVELQRGEA